MSDGGWVATHEDVTEQKCAEELVIAKASELQRVNQRFHVALSNPHAQIAEMTIARERQQLSNALYALETLIARKRSA